MLFRTASGKCPSFRFCELVSLFFSASVIIEQKSVNSDIDSMAISNEITAIPPTLANMTSLQVLFVDHVFPASSSLTRQEGGIRIISGNKIESLPESLGQLVHLTQINVQNNRLTSIPASISQLPITSLDLSNNQLLSLPDSISSLKLTNL